MDLNAISGGQGGVDATQGKSQLGKNDFLKLLLAQLSHQDPTSPSDSQAFVAQLAQFANVEQLQGVNQQLETLLMAQTSASQMNTVSLLGKQVEFRSNTLSFDGTNPASFRGELAGQAATVTAVIVDSSGKAVRKVELHDVPKGPVDLKWDGRADDGTLLPKGQYTVRLTAADPTGKSIDVDARGAGRVDSVSFASGWPELSVGGRTLTLRDIVSVNP